MPRARPLLNKPSLAATVSDSLVAYILEEGLEEGDAFPTTTEIADRYGVSLTVVREAIASLEGRGLLRRSQGRETVVITPGLPELRGVLQFRVLRDGVTAEQVLEARRGMETITVRLAAVRRTEANLKDLREALDEMAKSGYKRSFEPDVHFHQLLATAAQNPLLALFFDGIQALVREARIRAADSMRSQGIPFDDVVSVHRAIFDAVETNDPDGAQAALEEHFRLTAEALAGERQGKKKPSKATVGA